MIVERAQAEDGQRRFAQLVLIEARWQRHEPLQFLTRSAEEDADGVGFNFTKNVSELWHVRESIVCVPSAIAIAPLQRRAANGGTVHKLRKQMLGVALPIPKMRSALEQDDGVPRNWYSYISSGRIADGTRSQNLSRARSTRRRSSSGIGITRRPVKGSFPRAAIENGAPTDYEPRLR